MNVRVKDERINNNTRIFKKDITNLKLYLNY